MRRVISMCCSVCRQGELASTSTLHWEYSRGATVIFLGPPVTQQHSNDATNGNIHSLRSRSIWLIQLLHMLIKLRLQCIGNVCCVLLYSTQLCVHTKQWIQQRLHGNGATNGNAHSLAVGVYNSSIWMHLVSSKCVLC